MTYLGSGPDRLSEGCRSASHSSILERIINCKFFFILVKLGSCVGCLCHKELHEST